MEENKIQFDAAMDEQRAGIDNQRIIKTALATMYWLLVIVPLCFSAFFNIFPYSAMRFYNNLNMRIRTLESAEKYVNRYLSEYEPNVNNPASDTKYADALYRCIDLSIALMNESISSKGQNHRSTLKYAKKVVKYGTLHSKYISLQVRDEAINRYNLANIVYREAHPNFYDYKGFVMTNVMRARFLIENISTIYNEFMVDFNSINEIFGESIEIDRIRMNEFTRIFNMFSTCLELELDSIGFSYDPYQIVHGGPTLSMAASAVQFNTAKFKLLYNKEALIFGEGMSTQGKSRILEVIELRIAEFNSFVTSYPCESSEDYLIRAYWGKSMSNLATNIRHITAIYNMHGSSYSIDVKNALEKIYENWRDNYDRISIGGIDYDHFEWYRQIILNDYVQSFN